jgi:superfamily II DNA or RNA helicase
MDREEVYKEIISIPTKKILCELPTSFGKSKIGMDFALKYKPRKILIVIPRLVLVDNWKDEFIKWGNKDWLDKIEFSTYVGLNKHKDEEWDCVIFDEVHHLSERSILYVMTMKIDVAVMLSATISKDMLYTLKYLVFNGMFHYKIKIREAIDDNVLPDPRVIVIPLSLDTLRENQVLIEHPKAPIKVKCSYTERWKYIKDKTLQVHIKCTEYQYIQEINKKIDYWKRKYMVTRNDGIKVKWLYLAGQRLKFLSSIKNDVILSLLGQLSSERSLTFCSSIEQTEILGKNCINSKNKESMDIRERFNKGEIDHITACDMLNEGVNLVNCRIGLYANLSNSDRIIKQRLGRLLRHPDPVIIIPYYKNTRDEEIVNKMLEDYNPELVQYIELKDFKNIKL